MSFQATGSLPRYFKLTLCVLIVLALLAVPFVPATVAHAAGGLSISTTYPGITVKAGNATDFSIRVKNDSGSAKNVSLKIDSQPEGWAGYFEGNGNQISRVYVDNADSANVNYNVNMPADVAEGNYKIRLAADGGGGASDTLDLEINVSQTEISKGNFTSQFPELPGSSTATFKYSLNLVNNSSKDQSYSLSAKAPGDGWTVAFAPAYDTKQIASLSLEAGKTQGLDVTVTPPATVTKGTYNITCTAQSANETMNCDLTCIITGSYTMTLTTPSGLLNVDAYAGRETPVTLKLSNTGSAELEDIALSSSVSTDWTVRFDKALIDKLAPGASQEITAYIQPATNAVSGDYAASITATTKQTTASVALRSAVKTSTAWGIIGVVIILALIVGLFYVFRKFGRR
jgi:uncharacterized membrane protein